MIILATIAALMVGCNRRQQAQNMPEQPVTVAAEKQPAVNAIYHWKTTFALDSAECDFLRQHNVKRLYLRMFDVAVEEDPREQTLTVVPIATTRFEGEIPDSIKIIPTTYITLEALERLKGREKEFANLIVERLRAMASFNKCGQIREMQFDCDWTKSTEWTYFNLCDYAKQILSKDSIALSSTIRLHQLRMAAPPVDRGVLMLYNTGSLKNKNTKNSILDINDVEPYLKKDMQYPLPLDYAYPTFGWGVKFYLNYFRAIVSNPEEEKLKECETIRFERPTVEEVLKVKGLIEKMLGTPASANILYHLDGSQLKHYTDDEIAKIYASH